MKTRIIRIRRIVASCWLSFLSLCLGHDIAQGQTGPQNSDYVCVQRSPHSRIWQRTVVSTNAAGLLRTNIHSYTELATGLCYLENGQYLDSVEEIVPVGDGAEATKGRHKVHWAANANTPGGAVTMTTPDQKKMRSTVFGLLYFDSSTGSNVLLTQIQDCAATINSNTLTYGNAFSNITADVRYTYRKAGMSQDIVLKQQPPSPAEYGMNPDTTWLQVMTEFFNPPAPGMTTVTTNNILNDRELDFGDMKMGIGHAFLFQGDTESVEGGAVTKEWTNIDNRSFLIEEIPYNAVSKLLESLHSSLIKPEKNKVRRTVQLSPLRQRKMQTQKPARVAKGNRQEMGFVLDYDLLSSSNDCTFQGDTTYLVSGLCNLTGITVLEGGTVIKFTNNATAEIELTNLQCQTASYRPAVFTSMNDNSVGDSIPGSTGNPWNDDAGLTALNFLNDTATLQDVRFSHLAVAVDAQNTGGPNLSMSNFQVVDCKQVFESVGGNLALFNGLVCNVSNLFGAHGKIDGGGQILTAVNLTVDHCHSYAVDQTSIFYFTNCLFANTTNIYSIPSQTYTNSTVVLTNDIDVFQTVGAAGYYLAVGSTNRGAGTTNIGPGMLADLGAKTTYPPLVAPFGWFTNDYTFFPQAQRDNSGSVVDIGYHYDPIDYVVSIAISNATATVLPRTVLAGIGYNGYAVWTYSQGTFNCQGTATSPSYLVWYNTVQEQSNTNWTEESGSTLCYVDPIVDSGSAKYEFRFTTFSSLAGVDTDFNANQPETAPISMQDCQVYGGIINWCAPTILSTNCLYQRVNLSLQDDDASSNSFANNLFLEGEVVYYHANVGIWTFRDNLFDQDSISQWGNPVDISSNNAYSDTNLGIVLPSNDDVFMTNSPNYETGTLGYYYYPADQTNLIHQGSQLASAAGLYHYTVTTNNVIEGTNIVSIGFHYVACTNGVPIDSNGDGIPDYLEDSNGNGLVDSGEIAWDIPGDLGLTVVITQPANNSKLP